MHSNSIKTRCVVAGFLLLLVHGGAQGQQQQQTSGASKQCRPDRVTELLQEIMNCQEMSQPATPQKPMAPGSYAGQFGFTGVSDDFDFLNKGGPSFISGPGGPGGIGVLVSRPIPADVRPVQGDGIPSDSQFFIAGPRSRPNSFPSFGSGGGFPFSGRGGPPTKPQDNANGDGQQERADAARNFFPSFANSFGLQPALDFNPTFGGPPTTFGNPFESRPGPPAAPGANPYGFEISPSGPNSLGIDFDEIIRLLKELQGKADPDAAAGGKPEAGSGDESATTMKPDLDPNTTEKIIDVDTTMDPTTTEASATEKPTEKP